MHCYAFISDESLFMCVPFDVIVYLQQYNYNGSRLLQSLTYKHMVLDSELFQYNRGEMLFQFKQYSISISVLYYYLEDGMHNML